MSNGFEETAGGPGIVVGTDGSEHGLQAVRYAAREARRLRLPLTVVHVVPDYVPMAAMRPLVPDDLAGVGRTILAEAANEAGRQAPGLEVSRSLRHGDAAAALLVASRTAALLVLGHESVAPWRRVFTGAVTMKVTARATCPVVSVPEGWDAVPEPVGVVVAGFEDAAHDGPLLERAFDSAAARGAVLTIVHAWELPGGYDDIIVRRTHGEEWSHTFRERIEAGIADLRAAHPGVAVEVRVVHGQAAHALREASRGADLLHLSRRRAPGALGLGGTARALLREAACPVEVAPPPPDPGEGSLARQARGEVPTG